MRKADASPDGLRHDPLDQLRHDLKTPLAIIHGRAQLLARAVQRSKSLPEEERAKMLAGLTSIEVTVRAMAARIDAISSDDGIGGADQG
jgi:K+-sensing histidine kinase KdpD